MTIFFHNETYPIHAVLKKLLIQATTLMLNEEQLIVTNQDQCNAVSSLFWPRKFDFH
jgi:hypothetical protein